MWFGYCGVTSSQQNPKPSAAQGCVAIGCLGLIAIPVLAIIVTVLGSLLFSPEKTEKEKLKEWLTEDAPIKCEVEVQQLLRDPESYRRESGFYSLGEQESKQVLQWNFRAKNGFGGYNNGKARCEVEKKPGGSIAAQLVE